MNKTLVSPRKTTIDHGMVLNMHLRGLTGPEIGAKLGCSKQRIDQVLKPFRDIAKPPEVIDAYEKNKAQLLSSAEMEFLESSLDRLRQNKDPLPARVMGFGVVFDKNRLTRGESTQNVSIHSAIEHIQAEVTDLKAKRDAILSRLSK